MGDMGDMGDGDVNGRHGWETSESCETHTCDFAISIATSLLANGSKMSSIPSLDTSVLSVSLESGSPTSVASVSSVSILQPAVTLSLLLSSPEVEENIAEAAVAVFAGSFTVFWLANLDRNTSITRRIVSLNSFTRS